MRSRNRVGVLSAVAVLFAITAVTTTNIGAQAQQGAGGRGRGNGPAQAAAPAPIRVVVQFTEVKPDMVAKYQDLIKDEANPALKKAGVAYRWTWTNGPAGQAYTFISVQPMTNYAQYDQPGALQKAMGAEGMASYNAKLRPTIVSQHTFIQTLRQDISFDSHSTTAPAMAVVQTLQIAPGKGAEFTKVVTDDYIANYKKAGLKDFWVYATNYGAGAGQIVTVRPFAKYAELDGMGLFARAGITGDAAAQIGARFAAVATVIDNELVRFVPELSFGMPAASGTASTN